jgi:predicted dehydrogenase
MKKDDRRLRLGPLDCGPVSQAPHLDPIRKARHADLHPICDSAEDPTGRLAAIYQPKAVYNTFAAMLADTAPHTVFDGRTFESFIDGAGI